MTLQSVSKAIAGALVTALVGYLARKGLVLDQSASDALVVLASAVVGFAAVYVAPKNQE